VWDFSLAWYIIDMAHTVRQVVVGDRGRIVLPSAVCAALGITRGTRMLLSTETDGSLRLRPYRAVAEESRGLLAELTPAGASFVDELLAERRAEAALENAE
jgi:AbrB family looped-hinge helix DNA binding protein